VTCVTHEGSPADGEPSHVLYTSSVRLFGRATTPVPSLQAECQRQPVGDLTRRDGKSTPTAERRNHPPALARRLRCVCRSLYGFPAANPDRTRPFSAVEVQLVPAKVWPLRPTRRAEPCSLTYPRPNNFAIQANGPRLGGGAVVGLLAIAVLRCVPRHLGHGVRWSRGSFIHSTGNTVPQLPHAIPDGRASVMRAPLVAERAFVHTHVRSPVRQSARNRGR
jgi:hypothetical protein